MVELILASSNAHKAEEFSELFDAKVCKVVPANQKIEVDESGSTYFENALLKAKTYYDLYKKPVLSDDSGLNVAALPDELGIHSARFGGDNLTSFQRVELLLNKLSQLQNIDRNAYFTCVLCLYFSDREYYFFEGRVEGKISDEAKGEFGFGYDPVFLPTKSPINGASLAELPEWKNKNSHRANACQMLQKFLQERYCKN
jgi:XTP/dITP diphosphohydrolase